MLTSLEKPSGVRRKYRPITVRIESFVDYAPIDRHVWTCGRKPLGRASESGAYEVLTKPFDRAELVRTVLGAVALAPTAGVSAKVVNATQAAS